MLCLQQRTGWRKKNRSKIVTQKTIDRTKRDAMEILRVPGTKWCGKGFSATRYSQLGGYTKTDRCCRVHDLRCPYWIGGMEKKYGLYNWRVNTLMHCRCDERLVLVAECAVLFLLSMSKSQRSFFVLFFNLCFDVKGSTLEQRSYFFFFIIYAFDAALSFDV